MRLPDLTSSLRPRLALPHSTSCEKNGGKESTTHPSTTTSRPTKQKWRTPPDDHLPTPGLERISCGWDHAKNAWTYPVHNTASSRWKLRIWRRLERLVYVYLRLVRAWMLLDIHKLQCTYTWRCSIIRLDFSSLEINFLSTSPPRKSSAPVSESEWVTFGIGAIFIYCYFYYCFSWN